MRTGGQSKYTDLQRLFSWQKNNATDSFQYEKVLQWPIDQWMQGTQSNDHHRLKISKISALDTLLPRTVQIASG